MINFSTYLQSTYSYTQFCVIFSNSTEKLGNEITEVRRHVNEVRRSLILEEKIPIIELFDQSEYIL